MPPAAPTKRHASRIASRRARPRPPSGVQLGEAARHPRRSTGELFGGLGIAGNARRQLSADLPRELLEELADLLGGAVGGSRVVTNLGWRPHSDQVGQTGARIAPDLYIACGISGAIQHIVGCRAAKRILVINKDPSAPIVARADWAVIGDLHEVVPAIVAELRKDGV